MTRFMTDALKGLDNAERLACRVAERVTGTHARAWDVDGRVGAVDAFLDYPNGRIAAFEVTRIASQRDALQLDYLLGREGNEWRLPGQWWWTLSVADVRELPRLRRCFNKIVLLCEAAGVTHPNDLLYSDNQELDVDVVWLVEQSGSCLSGHPHVPAIEGNRVRSALITPASTGGIVDDSLAGLRDALTDAFTAEHLRRRVAKLARTPANERHLFAIVHQSDLAFEVASALMFGTTVPADAPWLPAGVTHLWLAPQFSRRVLLGDAKGWIQAHPYDN